MVKRAIVTVGVSQGGRWFKPYLERFRDTFRQYGGADYLKIWHREFPPGSPTHSESQYAFKAFAVKEAVNQGCSSVLYLDVDSFAFRSLDFMWERLERDGHVFCEDANRLGSWSSDASLSEFDMSRDEAMELPLFCGTCWGLDLRRWKSRVFLNLLLHYASIPDHFNGTHVSRQPGAPRPTTQREQMSSDPRCCGHRSDEVFMGLIAHRLQMSSHIGVEFIGGCGDMNDRACIRCAYDLGMPEDFEAAGAKRINGILDYCDGIDYND